MSEPLLKVDSLSVEYEVVSQRIMGARRQQLRAVRDVGFELAAGETLGIVGETGCGKTSLGKAILQLVRPAAGSVTWNGIDLCRADDDTLKELRSDLQIVFQDPLSALNPRMTVGEIIGEPLRVHSARMTGSERDAAAHSMLERVGLRPEMARRYPNEFSAGQCQRISIARAMITGPKLLVCDEPVSALDVSVQAQICNLLRRLQRETGVAMLFISHDLAVVRYISHRVMVLYLGRPMELGTGEALFRNARHPYTRALLDAVPEVDPDTSFAGKGGLLTGEIPSPLNPPSGCVFRTRCRIATAQCAERRPEPEPVTGDHSVACHHWRELERD